MGRVHAWRELSNYVPHASVARYLEGQVAIRAPKTNGRQSNTHVFFCVLTRHSLVGVEPASLSLITTVEWRFFLEGIHSSSGEMKRAKTTAPASWVNTSCPDLVELS